MPTMHSPSSPWLFRHRLQNEAFNVGKVRRVDERTSQRFAREFEQAVKARGDEAKRKMMEASLALAA